MASIEFDIEDILNSMMGYEKQELADELYEAGYVAKQVEKELDDEDDWDEAIRKLKGNKWRLSKEDEETILAITNKIIQ
jgi:hypothetical protein